MITTGAPLQLVLGPQRGARWRLEASCARQHAVSPGACLSLGVGTSVATSPLPPPGMAPTARALGDHTPSAKVGSPCRPSPFALRPADPLDLVIGAEWEAAVRRQLHGQEGAVPLCVRCA